jgi:hypothetical protein
MKKALLGTILLVVFAGCSKGDPNQDAANIVAGLAGDTGSSIAKSSSLTGDPAQPADSVGAIINQRVQGTFWLLRFADLGTFGSEISPGVPTATCNGVVNQSGCNSSCDGTDQIYTVACTLPGGSTSTCDGTQYTFNSTSFSIGADFTNVSGTWGSSGATGTLGLSLTIQADVSGGALNGGQLKCTLAFSVSVAALQAGTVSNFTPTCDSNFSCSYAGNAISCSDIQSRLSSSAISCS